MNNPTKVPAGRFLSDPTLRARVRELAASPYRAVPKILLDLAMWAGAAALGEASGKWWGVLLAALFIGAFPMHDLLVHGHDGTHRLISRRRRVNAFFTWLNHALFGLSGTAYGAFHLEHHRLTQTDLDPEVRLMRRLLGGRGWGYFLLPSVAHLAVNGYPFFAGRPAAERRGTVRDLLAATLLHAGLVALLGPALYARAVLLPAAVGLAPVIALRSLCKHHGLGVGDPWTNTRAMETSPLVGFLWSNTQYHLEHHLFPRVPFHRMPALRALLREEYARRNSDIRAGYLRTALRLVREPLHVKGAGV